MKPLASEFRYLTNSLLPGIFLVPGFLWTATRLLERYGELHARYLDLTSAHDKAAGRIFSLPNGTGKPGTRRIGICMTQVY